ncbi:MAG: glycogen synthase [Chlamydiota bacterium]
MNIVFVSSEITPIAKAGGLGDVTQGLIFQLQRLQEKVTLIVPKYSFIDEKHLQSIKIHSHFKSYEKGIWIDNTAWTAQLEGVRLILIEPHHPKKYFERSEIYGYDDDIPRFAYFSRAVFDFFRHENLCMNILHLHDWPTALLSILYKDLFSKPTAKIVLTIHNIEHQGRCNTWDMDDIGLESSVYKEKLKDPIYPSLNLLKGGILYADQITTVSPTYAKEILTKEYGYGLDPLLQQHKDKLTGILNGIDTDYWNPQTDPYLMANYSKKLSVKEISLAKSINKRALQKKFGLTEQKGPLITNIGRLVAQKGPALIKKAIECTVEKTGQFVLLGTSPIPEVLEEFSQLQKSLPPSKALFFFQQNESLSHWIYAASDFIIIPSLFEPCGLTQLIALRYGTIPIVRSTGGLKDTVFETINGYTFSEFSEEAMKKALSNAIQDFVENPKKIANLIPAIMNEDHSWLVSAKVYQELYQKALIS